MISRLYVHVDIIFKYFYQYIPANISFIRYMLYLIKFGGRRWPCAIIKKKCPVTIILLKLHHEKNYLGFQIKRKQMKFKKNKKG